MAPSHAMSYTLSIATSLFLLSTSPTTYRSFTSHIPCSHAAITIHACVVEFKEGTTKRVSQGVEEVSSAGLKVDILPSCDGQDIHHPGRRLLYSCAGTYTLPPTAQGILQNKQLLSASWLTFAHFYIAS
nr:hypothetical protein CFP56_70579 [Quercus suber]